MRQLTSTIASIPRRSRPVSSRALALIALAGAAAATPARGGVDFTFQPLCNQDWGATCPVLNFCDGSPGTANNWGQIACGMPAFPGVGADVLFTQGGNINVGVDVRTIVVNAGVAVYITGPGFHTSNGLGNSGVITSNGGNTSYGGAIINNPEATWIEESSGFARSFNECVFTNQGTLLLRSGVFGESGGANALVNFGSVEKSTGSTIQITLPVTNAGFIGVQQGSLILNQRVLTGAGGTLSVDSGATFTFQNAAIAGSITGSSAGAIATAGTLSTAVPSTVNITGNGLELRGDLNTTSGLLTNTGIVRYNGGNATYTGNIANANSGVWIEDVGFSRVFSNTTFTNNGLLDLRNVGLGEAAATTNSLVNNATINKTTGSTVVMTVPVVNAGAIAVQQGTLTLNQRTLTGAGGTLNVDAGAAFTFQNASIAGLISGSSAGTLATAGGLSTAAPSTLNITGNGFELRGDLSATAAPLTNTGIVRYNGGNATYTGNIINAAGGVWTEPTDFGRVFSGCTFTNNGLLEFRGIFGAVTPQGGTIVNNGTLNRLSGPSVVLDMPITNNGLLDAQTSSMFIRGGITQSASGATRVRSGASIQGNPITFAAGRLEGLGTIAQDTTSSAAISPGDPDAPFGTLTFGGRLTQNSTGTMEIGLSARPGAGNDRIVAGQQVAIDGALHVTVAPGFNPMAGDVYEIVRSNSGQRTGFFSSLVIEGSEGVALELSYTATNVLLTVSTLPCDRADFNADDFVNPDDLADFITCFFLDIQFPGFCPQADFNGDGFRDPDDLSDFITGFFVGVQSGC